MPNNEYVTDISFHLQFHTLELVLYIKIQIELKYSLLSDIRQLSSNRLGCYRIPVIHKIYFGCQFCKNTLMSDYF